MLCRASLICLLELQLREVRIARGALTFDGVEGGDHRVESVLPHQAGLACGEPKRKRVPTNLYSEKIERHRVSTSGRYWHHRGLQERRPPIHSLGPSVDDLARRTISGDGHDSIVRQRHCRRYFLSVAMVRGICERVKSEYERRPCRRCDTRTCHFKSALRSVKYRTDSMIEQLLCLTLPRSKSVVTTPVGGPKVDRILPSRSSG